MAQVLNIERAAGCRPELLELLEAWKIHGPHDITIPEHGGHRFGPIGEAIQENFARIGMSKAKTLKETPHGRRCGLDFHPVGFDPHRGFDTQPGMEEKFLAQGRFIEAAGLVWGGKFKGFAKGDMPHCELQHWSTRFSFPSGDPILQPVT